MTPEQFIKKWTPQAAEWLNVNPEALTMKDDLMKVINEALNAMAEDQARFVDSFMSGGEVKASMDGHTKGVLSLMDGDELGGSTEIPKEIGPDNWKFFGDYYTPPSA